ncbi:MAG: hypothetical protein KJO91_07600, partial [Gammaproteobacteria bacterium]|nr:hypothetical protein [Gammaproteobacteria bacterium]
ALITTSCSFIATKDPQNQSHHKVSKVRVNESITVPPGKTRVFFQDGKIVSQFNHYKPNCNIEVRLREDKNLQSIKPAEFQIVSIKQSYEQVVNFNRFQQIKLAHVSISGHQGMVSLFDNNHDVYRGYHFYLSGRDENVYRLSCRGVYAPAFEAWLPTFDEMKQSLGDVINLH